jgi:hypothetical protein
MGRDGFDSSAIKRALKEKPSAYAEMKKDYDFSKAVKNPYAARFHHLVESRGKSRLALRFNNPRKQEMPQPKNTVIFINYRRTDTGWPAEHLKDKLGAAFGKDRVFLDARDIDAGDDFNSEIESQLQRAAALIVLIDKNWLLGQDEFGRRRLDNEDDWVRKEIRTAPKTMPAKSSRYSSMALVFRTRMLFRMTFPNSLSGRKSKFARQAGRLTSKLLSSNSRILTSKY